MNNQQKLFANVNKQVEQLTLLGEFLEKELHLISSRDAESLIHLLDEKAALLDAIQTLDNDIENSLKSVSEEEINAPDIQSAMSNAKALLENCKYRTAINEKAVEQGQLRLSHLRNLMLEVRAKESLTYDSKGKPSGGVLGSGVSA